MARNEPTPEALKAAEVYLRKIDGDDFGDPDHGHSIEELARIIDKYVKQATCSCYEPGRVTDPKCPLHGGEWKKRSQRQGFGN